MQLNTAPAAAKHSTRVPPNRPLDAVSFGPQSFKVQTALLSMEAHCPGACVHVPLAIGRLSSVWHIALLQLSDLQMAGNGCKLPCIVMLQ